LGPALESEDLLDFDDDPDPPPLSESTVENIQAILRKVYADESAPTLVRRRTLEAAVRAEEDWQTEAIRNAYSGGQREWVLTALFCMKYVSGFDAQIVEAFSNPDPEIHREAILAAGGQELEEAWPHISSLLLNPMTPRELLVAAICAAGGIQDEEAPGLLRPFLGSPDLEIEEAARESLAMIERTYGLGEDDDEHEFF